MSHLWFQRDGELVALDLQAAHAVDLEPPLRGVDDPSAFASLSTLLYAEGGRWHLLHAEAVLLNGRVEDLPVTPLADGDEFRLRDGRLFGFSLEARASFEILAEPASCPRCLQTIAAGARVIRCPKCQIVYHEGHYDSEQGAQFLPCWSRFPTCSCCPQPTSSEELCHVPDLG